MPVPGRKPKDGPKRFRGAALTEWIEVEDTPFEGSSPDLPDLPDSLTSDGEVVSVEWPAQTRAWYEVVRHLPHAALWEAGEWQEVLTTALIHAAVWRAASNPTTAQVSELRQREKAIGLTADHRRDLRIRYVQPRPEQPDGEAPDPSVVVPFVRVRPTTDALET